MYSTHSLTEVQLMVAELTDRQPNLSMAEIAGELSLTEGEVTLALDQTMMTRVDGKFSQAILELLPEWGRVTTIVHSAGSIFEAKAPFPKGKVAHGYYNLMGGKEGQLHGHLRLDLLTDIAFVSKPFRGMESHYIGFYNAAGECGFKVYLGRDKKRQLIAEQVEKFNQTKTEFV